MFGVSMDFGEAVVDDHLAEAALSEPTRRDLRGKIAFAFGGSADVRQQQIENLSV
jgi:hypothetical protein